MSDQNKNTTATGEANVMNMKYVEALSNTDRSTAGRETDRKAEREKKKRKFSKGPRLPSVFTASPFRLIE